MKVLVIGEFAQGGSAETFADHIRDALEHMGHQAISWGQPDPGRWLDRIPNARSIRRTVLGAASSLRSVRRLALAALWRQAREAAPDLTIVCYDYLWPDEVARLRSATGSPVVLWYPDSISNFGRACFIAAPYDALFFKDPYIVKTLGGVIRSPVHYLPECFNPRSLGEPKREAIPQRFRSAVATVGNLHPWRLAALSNLADCEVRLWGTKPPQWMPEVMFTRIYQGKPVYHADKCMVFRGADIIVNTLHFSEIEGLNCRCFEAAGAGAFQLVDWRPALRDLFVDGEEIVTFRGMDDLRRKISFWLPRREERWSIGDRARARSLREHTYEHRLAMLVDTVSGRSSGFDMPPHP
jgi:spore maturation protein CgeB